MSDPRTPVTDPFADDRLHEECGIFGILGSEDAAAHTVLGLHALQHRGQEAAGITAFDGTQFRTVRHLGHVADNFTSRAAVEGLPGEAAIGHVRYSTTGEGSMRNVQPLFADLAGGGFAVAHNGNITNAMHLRRQLVRRGSIFQSSSDSEVIIHLVATSTFRTLLDKLIDALRKLEGAWSLVALTPEGLIGVRDPLGVRPLVLGRLGDSRMLCSETCALDIIGAEYVRDVEPGEIVILTPEGGVRSISPFPPARARPCIFEYVYFSRPDSRFAGLSVYEARKRIGHELAREAAVEADIVVPVPDSGVPGAIGYAEESGLPFELGIIRNHYVGRTFIEPSDQIRHLGVRLKHNANAGLIAGKRIVLVDDSIVRGTTSLKIVDMLRQAGAREVHMRIASPPTRHGCFYGVDTPERSKLLAAERSVEEMRAFIGADSLAFLSIDGLYRACGHGAGRDMAAPQHCDACFTGDYPTHLTDQDDGAGNQLAFIASTGA